MTLEELENLKEKYIELQSIANEIKTLEQKPDVKRYLELMSINGLVLKNDDELFLMALKESQITSTNTIYMYIGSYIDSDLFSQGHLVKKGDPNADYILYRDIESLNQSESYVKMSIFDSKEFELNHEIIYPCDESLSETEYSAKQLEHFKRKDLLKQN